jgi:hypothetical protein
MRMDVDPDWSALKLLVSTSLMATLRLSAVSEYHRLHSFRGRHWCRERVVKFFTLQCGVYQHMQRSSATIISRLSSCCFVSGYKLTACTKSVGTRAPVLQPAIQVN